MWFQETRYSSNRIDLRVEVLQAVWCGISIHGDSLCDSSDLDGSFDGRLVGDWIIILIAKSKETDVIESGYQIPDVRYLNSIGLVAGYSHVSFPVVIDPAVSVKGESVGWASPVTNGHDANRS
jgi:hypothetical protein